MKWTKDQQAIIDHRTGTLLVSAAAGSGKTAVLVQRILEWIVKDRKNIDEFLVVTFTKAAAGQMKSKIRKALEELQDQYPGDEHLIRQLSLIHRANIMTIDSFCKSIFNEHFHRLQLDPTMRIVDETEGVLMKEDVLNRILERAYEEQSDAMTELHGYMNDIRSNEKIVKLIVSIHDQACSFPYPEKWYEAAEKDAQAVTEEAVNQTEWMKLLFLEVRSLLADVEEIPQQVYEEYQVSGKTYNPKSYGKYEAYFKEECEMLKQLKDVKAYADMQELLAGKNRSMKRFVWKNTGMPAEHYLTELWKTYDETKKAAKEYVKEPIALVLKHQTEVSHVLQTIIELCREFTKEYTLEKQKKNCMDFSDVEHYALQILMEKQEDGSFQPSEIAEQLRDSFVEIMIDEYQDSNDLQEAILTSIAKQENGIYSNMFMVGDIKQSIYRFRMARPKLFQMKYESYDENLAAEGVTKKVELKQNFRSRKEVLDSVNLLFYQIMNPSLGGIDYNRSVALSAGRKFEELPGIIHEKQTEGQSESDRNQQTEGQSEPDQNQQAEGQGEPDRNQQIGGQSKPDQNQQTEGQSHPDQNQQAEGQNEPDQNQQAEGQSHPDQNQQTEGQSELIREQQVEQQSVESQNQRIEQKSVSSQNLRTEIIIIDSLTELEGEDKDNGTMESGEAVEDPRNKKSFTNTRLSDDEDDDSGDSVEEMTLEARVIAQKIHELCDDRNPMLVWDDGKKKYRPCTYKDIVILLRSGKGFAEEYRQVLMESGIPVYAESGKGYFDSVEVKNILNMLSVIDNARDDIALAGVLRSPLVGLAEEQLAELRCEYRDCSLWEAVLAYCSRDTEKGILSSFLTRLTAWKEKKTYCTIRELIWDILNETGYYVYLSAMPHGNIRQANIHKLIEKATAYETTSYRGLFDFLRYIERVRIAEQDFGEAAILGANDNLVQIMTIHKSKGLEFPVVIVGGCGKQFNMMDIKNPVLVDADTYLAVDDKLLNKHYYEHTEKREFLKQHMKEENLAEEMRILYVAMTRAQEKLIMVGSVKKSMAKNEDYQMIFHRFFEEGGKTYGGQIIPKAIPKAKLLKCASYLAWMVEGIYYMQNQGIKQDCVEYQVLTPDMLDWQVEAELNRFSQAAKVWEERVQGSALKEDEAELEKRFFWSYPHMAASSRKGKLSVSEIKKMSQVVDEPDQEEAARKVLAMNAKVSEGASYGTLIHLVMEKISFSNVTCEEDVKQELDQLVSQSVITIEEQKLIPIPKIYKMLVSFLGKRMTAADQNGRLYKEQQFVIGMPMKEVYPETREEDLELIQGIIDAYFEEDGEYVLMDYKTDRVSKEHGAKELVDKYHAQLEYYKKTLEQLTGKRVKESYLYSFALDEVIPVPNRTIESSMNMVQGM